MGAGSKSGESSKSGSVAKAGGPNPNIKPTIDPTDWANKRQMAMDKARETRERRKQQAKYVLF